MSFLRFNHQMCGQILPLQERAIKEAFLMLYAFAGAKKEDHFIFTSSGAEAVNHAILAAYLDITRKTGKNHFLCSALDEAPTIMAMSRLQEVGCIFQMIPPGTNCTLNLKTIAEMITPRTAMLSLSWANALTGVIQPLEGIAELCRDRGILFHVDASHILGKKDFIFSDSGADILTFSSPFGGTGGLFFRAGLEISPFILGGKEQAGMRGGAFSVSALIECAKWAKEERLAIDHYCTEIARLRALFEQMICAKLPEVKILFQQQERVPYITSFLFPGITSEALSFVLDQKGLKATYGGSHLQYFVHILKACAIKEPECHTGLSFAFSRETTEQEIERGANTIVETVEALQKNSVFLIDLLRNSA